MTRNVDVQITPDGMMITAEEVRGVGRLSLPISTVEAQRLRFLMDEAVLNASGQQEIRLNARGIQRGDRFLSLCGADVADVDDQGETMFVQFTNGTILTIPAVATVRILRAIQ